MTAQDAFSGCVYKGTSGMKWVNTPLYENKDKVIFVCVSVDQALISNENDAKN